MRSATMERWIDEDGRVVYIEIDERGVVEVNADLMRDILRHLGFNQTDLE
jgi:hypothetical protein